MKKSAFEKNLRKRIAGADLFPITSEAVLSHIVAAAVAEREAAGVVWDPEEEPLPERLEIEGSRIMWGVWTAAKITPRGGAPVDPFRIAAEAVRRWNAWPELRLAVEPLSRTLCPAQSLAKSVLAILDGKEGE